MTTVHMHERLLRSVYADPAATARAWLGCLDDTGIRAIRWGELLLGCHQHRVEALVLDAIELLGWRGRVSPYLVNQLERRRWLAEERISQLAGALSEVGIHRPELLQRAIALKGAALVGRYGGVGHRLLGDVDLLVPVEDADAWRQTMLALGFWDKPGDNGPTFFRDATAGYPGARTVVIDLHVGVPNKYRRLSRERDWRRSLDDCRFGDLALHNLSPSLLMVHVLVHMHEHAASWIHAALDDDFQMIRVIDVEVLCRAPGFDAGEMWRNAQALEQDGEVALALALITIVRGSLPCELSTLEPIAASVAHLTNLVALPSGELAEWPRPTLERVFDANRGVAAETLVAGTREEWYSRAKGRLKGSEPIAALATMAQDAVRGARR